MRPLDLAAIPLDGISLIEASAGTGKTHTITGLYLRLVVELGLRVEQILVVTFTNAATAELRERIRGRLVELQRAAESGTGEAFTPGQLSGAGGMERMARRLRLAVLDFDRAAIFTIHGFCQRVLAESAFESGNPFRTELIPDESGLLQEIVDDFWRTRVLQAPPGFVGYLVELGVTPDTLAGELKGVLGKPYLEVRGAEMPGELARLEERFHELVERAASRWRSEREEIAALLESPGLNKRSYPPASVRKWIPALEAFLERGVADECGVLEKFTRERLSRSVKKGCEAVEHPFFGLCDGLLASLTALREGYYRAYVALLTELVGYANGQLTQRKRVLGVQSYDDLLLDLDRALEGETGPRLQARIASLYRAALIDEFQDTDPLQYRIFSRLFGDGSLPFFMVGDPKQAIYSFRGADIFAYLAARDAARERYTLVENWRSAPALITAVNTLFAANPAGFVFSRIPFHPALPAPRTMELLVDEAGGEAVFRIGFIHEKSNKEAATELSVEWCCGEIERLLRDGMNGLARFGSQPLRAGDIAILVRSHRQGAVIRDRLATRGIHSVERSMESVFRTAEAGEVKRLLLALVEPWRESRVKAVLAGPLFGLDGNRIEELGRDEPQLELFHELFDDYGRLWREQGFMRMFRHLLQSEAVANRLLGWENGERCLTNLLHLAELLHCEERDASPGLEGLVKWLTAQMEAAGEEAHQLRLESDDALVQIVTIHKSKGLQYPVVFVPFAWHSGAQGIKPGRPYRFHDPAAGDGPVLELGSDGWEAGRPQAEREGLAEELRLLYVALTRAQQRCYLGWGHVNGAEHSAISWLLHGTDSPAETGGVPSEDPDGEMMARRLHRLQQAGGGAFSVEPMGPDSPAVPAMAAVGTTEPAERLQARRFGRFLRRRRRITSFSALSAHGSAELPDHDAGDTRRDEAVPAPKPDIFSFPRGAAPGSCIHGIFERLDFVDPDGPPVLDSLVLEQLDRYGLDPAWRGTLAAAVRGVLNTPLVADGAIRLGTVPRSRRLVELEFHFPVSLPPAGELGRLLGEHGFPADPAARRVIEELGFTRLQGYMKGFIDLVFEHEGRFYILDYKSNWLGNRRQDYGADSLAGVMAREGYYLQYLLYTLALHRYLRLRLPDYDYAGRFGGVFYLFLRGMDPGDPGGCGIFHDRPDPALVEALDSLLGRRE